MKILVAIPSCRAHAAYQKAQRDTWIKDATPYVDVKFFVGHSDGLALDEVCLGEDDYKPEQGLKKYPTLPTKTKKICGWAHGHGYEYLFKADTDTLISIANLLNSNFDTHDYSGGFNQEVDGEFCSGGAGYWLSRTAMLHVFHSSFEHWAEDVRTALVLKQEGILPWFNSGYRWKPGEPIDRDMITLHLSSVLQRGKYDPVWMRECYEKMKAL